MEALPCNKWNIYSWNVVPATTWRSSSSGQMTAGWLWLHKPPAQWHTAATGSKSPTLPPKARESRGHSLGAVWQRQMIQGHTPAIRWHLTGTAASPSLQIRADLKVLSTRGYFSRCLSHTWLYVSVCSAAFMLGDVSLSASMEDGMMSTATMLS